ncbi:MAG: KTSC domain-containing protein [Faecousia sp.]
MKRLNALFLALLLLLSLSSCGTPEESPQPTPAASSSSEETIVNTEPPTTKNEQSSTREHDWIDVDGDGEEEYVEITPIEELDLDTIFSDPELTEMFFDSSSFNIRNYEVDTILSYPQLREYCIDHCDFEEFAEWFDTDFSTCFSGAAYSPIWEILAVEFRESGAVYYCYDVPREIGEWLVESDTIGEDYNEYIKGQYPCERIS